MLIHMTHKIHGAMHVYAEMDVVAAEKNGWVRTQAPAPVEAPAVETPQDDDKEALILKAEALGVRVDRRWSIARLKEEIASAE